MNLLNIGLGTIFGAMVLAAPAQSAVWTNVWSTDFNNNVVFQTMGPFGYDTATYTAGGAAFTNSQSLPGFGTRYLRNPGTGTTSFAFTGLDWHRALKLEFDLAFLDSWDRPTDTRWGPDWLFVTMGNTTHQWSPYEMGPPAARGHFAQNGNWQDSVFRLRFILPGNHPDFTFALRAGGKGFQGGNDESWGIDNIRLSAAVPEPATWALLIAGFGLVGAAVRRRRAGIGRATA